MSEELSVKNSKHTTRSTKKPNQNELCHHSAHIETTVILGSRYFFLIDTDRSRRSRVNDEWSAERKHEYFILGILRTGLWSQGKPRWKKHRFFKSGVSTALINIFRNCSCILLLVVIKQNNKKKKTAAKSSFIPGKFPLSWTTVVDHFQLKNFYWMFRFTWHILPKGRFWTSLFRTASDRTDVAAFFGFRAQKQELFYRLHTKKNSLCRYMS